MNSVLCLNVLPLLNHLLKVTLDQAELALPRLIQEHVPVFVESLCKYEQADASKHSYHIRS